MAIGQQNCRPLQRALAKDAAGGGGGEAAEGHGEITAAGEDVDRVDVDEPAIVVADVDDDSLARPIFGIEVDRQLCQRLR